MSALWVSAADLAEIVAYFASLPSAETRLYAFVSTNTPTKADTFGTYTLSSDGILATVPAASWVYTLQGDGSYLGTYGPFPFTVAASQTLYGLLLTDTSDNLIAVAQFSAPVVVPGTPTAYNFFFGVDIN